MSASGKTHSYSLFGLTVRSALELPELIECDHNLPADVTIATGPLPEVGTDFDLHGLDGDLHLGIPRVARFRIAGGTDIVVDPVPGVPDRNVRVYLLGSAFGALLHQRGMLPLHANAVMIGGKAFAFIGQSGAGKSTLAAWFHDRGDLVIADDVCVIGFGPDDLPHALPGLPRLRLWAEAMAVMDRDPANYQRSYVGDDEVLDKYDVPIKRSKSHRGEVPLAAIYWLDRGSDFAIEEVAGMRSAEAIIANTYRGAYVAAVDGQRNNWQAAVRLARSVPVFRAIRHFDLADFDAQARRLRSHALALAEEGKATDGST